MDSERPQRLPCRHARGAPEPPRALVWSHWAQDKPPHEGRGEPETPRLLKHNKGHLGLIKAKETLEAGRGAA